MRRSNPNKSTSKKKAKKSRVPASLPLTSQEQRTEFGNAVIGFLKEQPPIVRSNTNEADNAIRNAINSGNFHDAFIPLKIKRDFYRGVTTYTLPQEWERPVLIRDARPQKPHLDPQGSYRCEASYYKYVQLGFNYLNGLMDLLEIENNRRTAPPYIDMAVVKQDLIRYAHQYYKDIAPADPNDPDQQKKAEAQAEFKFGRFFHSVLIPYYRQYRPGVSKSIVKKELQMARNFANMRVQPYVVATVSRHDVMESLRARVGNQETMDVVELELPMVELTARQRELYTNRVNEAWYTNQSELAQRLIDKYEPLVLAGAMIPAQLIYHLIGTRNGYEKWTVVLNATANGNGNHHYQAPTETQPVVVNKAYHAGSQGHLLRLSPKNGQQQNRSTQDEMTRETIDQLCELTDAHHLTINTLLTPLEIRNTQINQDSLLVDQIARAVNNSPTPEQITMVPNSPPPTTRPRAKSSVANTPQNWGRRLQTNNKEHNLDGLLAAADSFLQNQDNTEHPHYQKLKDCFDKLKEAIKNPSGLRDPNNANLEIAAQANLLADIYNQCVPPELQIKLAAGCLSGQDRGGMVSTHTTNEALYDYLTGQLFPPPEGDIEEQAATIRTTQAMAGHTQEMAGNAGTGFGGDGIKIGSKDIIPKKYPSQARKMLTSPTGIYNEHTPQNPARPFYKKKSFWIGVGLVVLGLCLAVTGILALKGIVSIGIGSKIALKATCGVAISVGVASEIGAVVNYRYARKRRLEKYPYTAPALRTTHHKPTVTAAPLLSPVVNPEPAPSTRPATAPAERPFPRNNPNLSLEALACCWKKGGIANSRPQTPVDLTYQSETPAPESGINSEYPTFDA